MDFARQTPEWQPPLTLSQPTPATPPRSTHTSVPKSVPERKPKLRASCDACAASKVKCSKEHPICARCLANDSECIYGVSRKHGKPGRVRKRNPDGTPFIKASKQRPSPDGREFSKFRVRPEPIIREPDMDTRSNWSPTPSWSPTPEFEFEMTPEPPLFMEPPNYNFDMDMDEMLLNAATTPEFDATQTIQPELIFVDPFARKQSVRLDLPDIQALKDFIGGDTVNPMDYSFSNPMHMDTNFLTTPTVGVSPSPSTPRSPKSTPAHLQIPPRFSISMPSSHCCYTLAYSTLESLRIINPQNSTGVELKSLDSVLSITKTAVANVHKLLACSCSSDPTLAMLYSSITSKILTWYQIAAGVKPANPPATPALSDTSSRASSTFSSPLSTPSSDNSTFDIEIKPFKIGIFEFDESEQEMLRRQVVLRELKKCGTLVDALANWGGNDTKTQQAEFLYDVLGAWLKTELHKTLRQVEGEDDDEL